jgi:acetaldehyde dehydrogenase
VFCALPPGFDAEAIADSIESMVADVARFVPGYRLMAAPQFEEPDEAWEGNGRVTVLLEVEGRGDYFPPYAGNLDIMTAAASQVGHELAKSRSEGAS